MAIALLDIPIDFASNAITAALARPSVGGLATLTSSIRRPSASIRQLPIPGLDDRVVTRRTMLELISSVLNSGSAYPEVL